MKKRIKIKGALRSYLRWPIYMTVLLLCMNICIYVVNHKAGFVMLCFLLIYFLVAIGIYMISRVNIVGDLVHFAAGYGQIQRRLLKELSLPYAILDIDGRLLWGNDEFMDTVGERKATRRPIESFFPEIVKDKLPVDEADVIMNILYEERNYRVVLRRVTAPEFDDDVNWSFAEIDDNSSERNALIALYLHDETENTTLKREISEQKLIVGLLYIDNYEEALDSIDEVRRSLLTALVDRKVTKYMQSMDAIVKKLEKDKYIFVLQYKYLPVMQNNKFFVLEEVRNINIGNDMSVTISIGLGVNGDTFSRGYEYARAAIDLALGRGGDQAVVKDRDKLSYYGGKSVQVEKNTRVKARVKAHALKEFIEAKDKVVIMGHKLGDVDSLGAAIGVYRIAKTLNKKVYIVINEITSSLRPLLSRFLENSDYEEDLFIKSGQAIEVTDVNTLVVVVDVNRPSYTECEELLGMTKTVVILDHHRQMSEAIDNAVLSYIEPYASSTCEMVAEVLQYIGEGLKLKQAEADAMYSGIMIDTNNFLTKTGVRTFEAAAFLRRSGADVTRIRKSFRTDMIEYKAKADVTRTTELFLNEFAIAECTNTEVDSPTILAAQAANDLLSISNVKASFVFTEFNGQIYVSARSIDEVNVQIIMEKLNGGGHMSSAGAQFTHDDMEEAKNQLKDILREMKLNKEL